jgi:hypothetical protein
VVNTLLRVRNPAHGSHILTAILVVFLKLFRHILRYYLHTGHGRFFARFQLAIRSLWLLYAVCIALNKQIRRFMVNGNWVNPGAVNGFFIFFTLHSELAGSSTPCIGILTSQDIAVNADRHSCLEQDSIPRSRCLHDLRSHLSFTACHCVRLEQLSHIGLGVSGRNGKVR